MDGIQGVSLRRKSRGNPFGIKKILGCAFIPTGGPQAHDKLIGKVSPSSLSFTRQPSGHAGRGPMVVRAGTSGIPWLGGRIFVLLVLGAGIEPHRFSPSATANALTNRLQEQSLFLPLL
jgi:hypothetical protein